MEIPGSCFCSAEIDFDLETPYLRRSECRLHVAVLSTLTPPEVEDSFECGVRDPKWKKWVNVMDGYIVVTPLHAKKIKT